MDSIVIDQPSLQQGAQDQPLIEQQVIVNQQRSPLARVACVLRQRWDDIIIGVIVGVLSGVISGIIIGEVVKPKKSS